MIALDASFLLAALDRGDAHFAAAQPAWAQLIEGRWGRGLLHELAFVEAVSAVKERATALQAARIGTELWRARELEFVPSSAGFLAAWGEFQGDLSSPLSFTDHAVALLARERAGGKLLTFHPALRSQPGLTAFPEVS